MYMHVWDCISMIRQLCEVAGPSNREKNYTLGCSLNVSGVDVYFKDHKHPV